MHGGRRGRRSARPLVATALVAACACALGDILDPGPGTLVVGRLTSLAIFPPDTLLANPGDEFCYRPEARDSAGALVPDVEPEYGVAAASGLIDVSADGCVIVLAQGGVAQVVARLGTLNALGTVRIPAPGEPLVATLEVAPADTTLTEVGAQVCYRWSARDAVGTEMPQVAPSFTLRSNPGGRLSKGPEAHCFSVTSLGVVNATVDATADTVTVSVNLRVRP